MHKCTLPQLDTGTRAGFLLMDWDREGILDPCNNYWHLMANILLLELTIYLSHASLKDISGSMDLWYRVARLVEAAVPFWH